jgi:hypothetical protein
MVFLSPALTFPSLVRGRPLWLFVAHDLFRNAVATPHQVGGRLSRDHALGALWMDCAHVHKARQFEAALLITAILRQISKTRTAAQKLNDLAPHARLREYGAARIAVARMTRRSSDFRERIARITTD